MKYKTVTSPRYADAEQSGIAANVVFIMSEAVPEVPASDGRLAIPAVAEVLSEPWPFLATPTDSEAHGREIYRRAVAGDFGPIAPYVATP